MPLVDVAGGETSRLLRICPLRFVCPKRFPRLVAGVGVGVAVGTGVGDAVGVALGVGVGVGVATAPPKYKPLTTADVPPVLFTVIFT